MGSNGQGWVGSGRDWDKLKTVWVQYKPISVINWAETEEFWCRKTWQISQTGLDKKHEAWLIWDASLDNIGCLVEETMGTCLARLF